MYKVLLVDDDRIARCVCANIPSWEKKGFSVMYEADNGIDALEVLKHNNIDVVFTDIRMPGMDGISMLKKIRADNINVFVVLVSLYKEFEYAREGLKLGAVDYIMKPVTERSLDETLDSVRSCLCSAEINGEFKRIVDDYFENIGADTNDIFVNNLRELFSQHLGDNLTMDGIADRLGFSKDYFGKMVKQKTGLSFNKFFTGIKMRYAKELVISGRYKVYEISDMMGYANPDYFTRIFKAEFGMSPADFKRTPER